MNNDHAHEIFQPLLNAISHPKTMCIARPVCYGTRTACGAVSYDSNVETYGGPCSRCGGERTIEVRV